MLINFVRYMRDFSLNASSLLDKMGNMNPTICWMENEKGTPCGCPLFKK